MKTNKKTLYIAIAFVCILVVSIFVTVKNKDSASLAPADNPNSSPSSEVGSSTTEQETYLPFEYEETEEASEESPTKKKVKEVHTTTKPTTTRKDTTVDSQTSATKKENTTAKVTTTTKKVTTTTTKPSTTKPTTTKPTTTQPTTTTPGKVLYYYTDGTTGYEPKPGAEYYSNGCWQIVYWGNSVTDDEIKEAHKNDSTDPWY